MQDRELPARLGIHSGPEPQWPPHGDVGSLGWRRTAARSQLKAARASRIASAEGPGQPQNGHHVAKAEPEATAVATATRLCNAPRHVGFARDTLNPSSPSASMNAFAVSNLSAGSFSIAFETVAATCGGTVCLSSVSEVASFVRMCTRIDCALGPVVRWLASDHLVQHTAQAVDIGAGTEVAVCCSPARELM